MNSEWYSPKEIAQMPGMPGTIQGVHKRAKREGWPSRRRLGVQGPAMEYRLGLSHPFAQQLEEPGANYKPAAADQPHLALIWQLAFQQCAFEEQSMLITHLMTHGILHFLAVTAPCQLKIMRLLRKYSEEQIDALLQSMTVDTSSSR